MTTKSKADAIERLENSLIDMHEDVTLFDLDKLRSEIDDIEDEITPEAIEDLAMHGGER